MHVLFLTKYTARGPSSRYRVLQFLPFLDSRGVRSDVHALHDDNYLDARFAGRSVSPLYLARRTLSRLAVVASSPRYDLVFIQKEMLPHVVDVPEWYMARRGVRYVVDLDDAIHLMYSNARGLRGMLRDKLPRVLSRASLVLAGNRYLEAYARKHTGRVMYFPTVVDTAKFTPSTGPVSDREPVVGWMGTPETVRYLAAITPALEAASAQVAVSLFVVGADAPASRMTSRSRPWSETGEAADLRAMDIGVMPLADDEWSKGKCALKLLQYMSAGLPSVTSPSGSAVEFVQNGVNASFATSEAEWCERIVELARSPERRADMARHARAEVDAHYSLRVWGPRFGDALEWAAGGDLASRPAWSGEGTRYHG